jgi:hypothetical protein
MMGTSRWIALGALLLAVGLWLAGSPRPQRPAAPAESGVAAPLAPAATTPELMPPSVPTPAEREPASAPRPPAAPPTAYVDAAGSPSRELVRAALEAALADHWSSYKLTPAEVERITDAVLSLREAQAALRELPASPEVADRRRALVERIGQADADFAEVMEMSFAEFTRGAGTGAGVDRAEAGEVVPPPEYLDDFR